MTDITITGLPPASSAGFADLLASDQADGFTRRISVQQILELVPIPPTLAAPAAGLVYSDGGSLQDASMGVGLSFNNGTLSCTITGGGGGAAVPAAGLVFSDGSVLRDAAMGNGISFLGGTLSATGALNLPQNAQLLGSDGNGNALALSAGLGLVLQGGQLLAESELGYMLANFGNGGASLAVPGQTLTQIPLNPVVDDFHCFNSSTGLYTTPIGAGYSFTGVVSLADTGTAGMAPAGSRVGLAIIAPLLGGNNTQWGQVGNTSTTLDFLQQAGIGPGNTYGLYIYSDKPVVVTDAQFNVQVVA